MPITKLVENESSMIAGIEEEWVEVICRWAKSEPLITTVYLFGSRVKARHGADSDLDVAVVLAGQDDDEFLIVPGEDDNELLGNWITKKAEWVTALQRELPVKLDLQLASHDDVIVMPAIKDHGIVIFDRTR